MQKASHDNRDECEMGNDEYKVPDGEHLRFKTYGYGKKDCGKPERESDNIRRAAVLFCSHHSLN